MCWTADDALLREEDRYLLAAADLGAAEAAERVRALGGACFPAHIDREGYSLLSSLGAIPPEPGYRAVEISLRGDVPSLLRDHPELQHMLLLQNSDSHDSGADAGPAGVGGLCRKIPPPACWMRSTGALRRAGPAPAEGERGAPSVLHRFVNFFTTHFLHFPLFPKAFEKDFGYYFQKRKGNHTKT